MLILSTLAIVFLACLSSAAAAMQTPLQKTAPFYSSSFVMPKPPNITAEFKANWMQHKFEVGIDRHITSGFLYLSPSQQKIRLDAADDGTFESSLFDFTNTTTDGLVSNKILAYDGGVTSPTCSYFYVSPFIILLSPDILTTTGAVYTGYFIDELYGQLSGWEFTYGNVLVHFYLDQDDTLVRYDFAVPGPLRTFTTTRFFNIQPGPINSTVFQTSCN